MIVRPGAGFSEVARRVVVGVSGGRFGPCGHSVGTFGRLLRPNARSGDLQAQSTAAADEAASDVSVCGSAHARGRLAVAAGMVCALAGDVACGHCREQAGRLVEALRELGFPLCLRPSTSNGVPGA